ncbi:MAG TPA: hypothetical protein VH641_10560 [Streptosporangiaceae bacterium]|jgi:hypothetical protein
MSLGEWERRALTAIEAGLARSDPALAALLRTFSRLVSGEAMPVRAKIQALRRRAARRHSTARLRAAARRRARPVTALMQPGSPLLRRGWLQVMPLLWIVISAGLIAVALALSTGEQGRGSCTPSMGVVCGGQAAGPAPSEGLMI